MVQAGGTLHVLGGGHHYLGECGGNTAEQLSNSSGISISTTLSIVGIGSPVIDCERHGRGFRFDPPGSGYDRATLFLEGITVINGKAPTTDGEDGNGGAVWASATLFATRCTFAFCKTPTFGGGIYSVNAPVSAHRSNFVNCSAAGPNGDGGGGGGGIYAIFNTDVFDLAAIDIDSCNFTNTTVNTFKASTSHGFTSLLAFRGGGVCVDFVGTRTSNVTLTFKDTNFRKATAKSGGGLYILFGNFQGRSEVKNVTTNFHGCTFNETWGWNGAGSGFNVRYPGPAWNANVLVHNSSFIEGNTNEDGGGFAIEHRDKVAGGTTGVLNCNFVNNTVSNTGGAFSVYYKEHTTGTALLVENTQFENSSACNTCVNLGSGAGGVGLGGGISLSYASATENTRFEIANSTFLNCSAIIVGGGIQLSYAKVTNDAKVYIVDTHFIDNAAPVGGGVFLQINGVADNTSVGVERSLFLRNNATGIEGGGGLYLDLPQDLPQNKIFVGDQNGGSWKNHSGAPMPLPKNLKMPCSSCGSFPQCSGCPDFNPVFPAGPPVRALEGIYREWTHENFFYLREVRFKKNSASFIGGGFCAPNGGLGAIEHCEFDSNEAEQLFGGGAAVGGTVSLSVANSTWKGNICGQRGCQVYSTSGAGIEFKEGSVVAMGGCNDDVCSAGFSAEQTGNVSLSVAVVGEQKASSITCQAGFQLLNASAIGVSTTLGNWNLKAPIMSVCGSSVPPGECLVAASVTNCPCYFSDNPFGGQYTAGNGNGTVFPKVLISTVSYACRACPVGQFNPIASVISGRDANTSIGTCVLCPAGKFQNETGQEACEPCDSGSFQNKPGQKSCVPCDGTFQLRTGSTACVACPFGAICGGPGGAIVPKAGYFGIPTTGETIKFALCPKGYCVETNDGTGEHAPNSTFAQCARNSNRDFSTPLCGACLPGFSQSVSNVHCVPNDTCTGVAVWFWVLAVFYCVAYSYYFLWSSIPITSSGSLRKLFLPPRADSRLSSRSSPGRFASRLRPSSCCSSLQSMFSRGKKSRVGQALLGGSVNVLAYFYQMAGLVIPLDGLAAQMGADLKLLFGMQVSNISNKHGGFCIWPDMSPLAKIEMHYVIPLGMVVVLRAIVIVGPAVHRCFIWCAAPQPETDATELSTPIRAPKKLVPLHNLRARFPGAMAQLSLLAYTALSDTTLQLVNCVTLPGSNRSVLFLAGSTLCGLWQLPFFLFFGVLVLLPLVPLLVFYGRQQRRVRCLAKAARAVRFPSRPSARGIFASLTLQFKKEYWHWPALLALQRLAMVATPKLIANDIQSAIALAFIAMIMQVAERSCSEYRNPDVSKHQKLTADCLLALTLLNIPFKTLTQASVDVSAPVNSPLLRVCNQLQIGMAIILTVPAVLPLLWDQQRRRSLRSKLNGGDEDEGENYSPESMAERTSTVDISSTITSSDGDSFRAPLLAFDDTDMQQQQARTGSSSAGSRAKYTTA
jgi:hypothetical protein